jgi:hypothetical protein
LANKTRGRISYRYTLASGIKVLGFYQEATKRLSSIIIQMRTGKIGLNAYLYSRKVLGIDSPNCTCGFRLQTIEHVFLDCRKYQDLRRHHFGQGHKTVDEILSTPKLTLKVAEFIEATQLLGQFRRLEEEDVY